MPRTPRHSAGEEAIQQCNQPARTEEDPAMGAGATVPRTDRHPHSKAEGENARRHNGVPTGQTRPQNRRQQARSTISFKTSDKDTLWSEFLSP